MNGDQCRIENCINLVVNQGRICNWHRFAKRKYGSYDHPRVGHKVEHKKARTHNYPNTRDNHFYNKTLVPDENGCMNWIGGKNQSGYGNMWHLKRMWLASRYSFKLYNGLFNESLCVLHKCDNPSCVAPEHLFIGTKKDNMRDCSNKGRVKIPNLIGEKCPTAILKNDDVLKIKEMLKNGIKSRVIAEHYKVHSTTIYKIKNGKNWRHI